MIVLREITQWEWKNHTYFVNDKMDKLLGYQPDGEKAVMFDNPMDFSTSKRKFTKIREELEANVERIVGSSGNVYFVSTMTDGTKVCSCMGYKYHGRCRHI